MIDNQTITILFIICILVLYFLFSNRESFTHPSNSFEVPKNKMKTLYEEDTTLIDDTLETINTSFLPDYISTFKKYPSYYKFELDELFKEYTIQTIKSAFNRIDKLKGSKLEIVRNLYNIWWKDDKNDRYFIFNIDLINKTKFFARKMLVYIKLKDINKFLTDNGDYIPGFKDALTSFDLQLMYIGTDNELKYFTVSPSNSVIGKENFTHLYRIKNSLYLMDPFITSGRELVISDFDKLKFQQYLMKKEKEQNDKTRGGFCYNSSNVYASTKTECIDSGGVWDYSPQDDVECPFYGANQNYPNNFGKITGDQCQFPRNMQIIGKRNFSYDPQYAPLCYNCKNKTIGQGTLGFCCDEQNNKQVYPTLLSPDYAFIGDTQQRQKYKEELNQKTLSIN
jgi:hypothetical protein